jgi:hypothetical protein
VTESHVANGLARANRALAGPLGLPGGAFARDLLEQRVLARVEPEQRTVDALDRRSRAVGRAATRQDRS